MNDLTIQIRRAALKDADLISNLVHKLLQEYIKQGANFETRHEVLEEVSRELIQRENFTAFLAFEARSEKAIGLITITQGTAIYNLGDFGLITELYVDEEYRNHRIGKRLLEKAVTFAKEKGWKKVEASAPGKGNVDSIIRFYTENGFIEKGPKLGLSFE